MSSFTAVCCFAVLVAVVQVGLATEVTCPGNDAPDIYIKCNADCKCTCLGPGPSCNFYGSAYGSDGKNYDCAIQQFCDTDLTCTAFNAGTCSPGTGDCQITCQDKNNVYTCVIDEKDPTDCDGNTNYICQLFYPFPDCSVQSDACCSVITLNDCSNIFAATCFAGDSTLTCQATRASFYKDNDSLQGTCFASNCSFSSNVFCRPCSMYESSNDRFVCTVELTGNQYYCQACNTCNAENCVQFNCNKNNAVLYPYCPYVPGDEQGCSTPCLYCGSGQVYVD